LKRALFILLFSFVGLWAAAQSRYSIRPVEGVNSPKDDIACGLLNDKLMVVTTEEKNLVSEYSWNSRAAFFLSEMTRGSDFGKWSDKKKLFNRKSLVDEGPASFDFRDSTLYFSTSACYGNAKGNRLKIYTSKMTETGWTDPQLLSFCNAENDYAHPSFDAERNLLVFSSDRAGGFGMMDIWYIYKTENGWSEAVNPGELVKRGGKSR